MNAMRNDGLRMNRRRFLQQLGAGSAAAAALPVIAWAESVELRLSSVHGTAEKVLNL